MYGYINMKNGVLVPELVKINMFVPAYLGPCLGNLYKSITGTRVNYDHVASRNLGAEAEAGEEGPHKATAPLKCLSPRRLDALDVQSQVRSSL